MAGAWQNCCCQCRQSKLTARLDRNYWSALFYPTPAGADFLGWLGRTCTYSYSFIGGEVNDVWSVTFGVTMNRFTGKVESFTPLTVDATTRSRIEQAIQESVISPALFPEDSGSRDFTNELGETTHWEWRRSAAEIYFLYHFIGATAEQTIEWTVTNDSQLTDKMLQDDLFVLAFATGLVVVDPITGDPLTGLDGVPAGVDVTVRYPAPPAGPPYRYGPFGVTIYAPDVLLVIDRPDLYPPSPQPPEVEITSSPNVMRNCVIGDGGTLGVQVGAELIINSAVTPQGVLVATRFFLQPRLCKFDRVVYANFPVGAPTQEGEYYENCGVLLRISPKDYIDVIPEKFSGLVDALSKTNWRRVYVKNRNVDTGSDAVPRAIAGVCECFAP